MLQARIDIFSMLFLLMMAIIPAFTEAQEKKLPSSLQSFVLKGHEVLDFLETDLNADKKADAILILKVIEEDTITTEDPKRPFLLLIRQPGEQLALRSRNDNLVMCYHCGGVFGDPYEGLTAIKDGFTISFYGGSSWRWGQEYSFVYDSKRAGIFLSKEKQVSYHSTDPELNIKETVIDASELGDVRLEDFNVEPSYTEHKWKVSAAKAYFYDSPKVGSKPRKGYLLKDDVVTGTRVLKNFVRVYYQNKKEEYTYGYILRADLLPAN